eukprot:TRINITY_DN7486_c0_g1_i1.p1 TRINITY_DN7486_c0_g1~~TRINITY_DN7486_c0_g1_i1.p1  ORF type:complete len:102 (+),score=2.62 TRINITY_DN7486_c0_g1_i1:122-427(+)
MILYHVKSFFRLVNQLASQGPDGRAGDKNQYSENGIEFKHHFYEFGVATDLEDKLWRAPVLTLPFSVRCQPPPPSHSILKCLSGINNVFRLNTKSPSKSTQ